MWDPAEVPFMTRLWERSLQQVSPCKIPQLLQREKGWSPSQGKVTAHTWIGEEKEKASPVMPGQLLFSPQAPTSHAYGQVPLPNSSSGAEKTSPRSSSQVYPFGPVSHPQGTDQAKRCGEHPQARANKPPSSHSENILIWMQSSGLPASPSFTHFSSLIQGIPMESDSGGRGEIPESPQKEQDSLQLPPQPYSWTGP